jgi:D-3-phosphoglycerate dehydrogenase
MQERSQKIKLLLLEDLYSKLQLNRKIKKKIYFLNKKNFNKKNAFLVEAIYSRFQYNLNQKFLSKFKNLKYILTNVTGLDKVDLVYAKKKKIKVFSLKNKTQFLKKISSTAEFTFALILALVRKIPAAHQSVVSMRDDRYNFLGENIKEKTLGIIGMGRNGKLISHYAKAFNMRVIYNDVKKKGPFFVNLKQLFKCSDIISVNVELNKKTEKLINWNLLKNVKKGAIIVNTSRAEILDQKSIIRAIKKNLLSGIALDFLEKNKNKYTKNSIRLINLAKKNKNIILTPHIGGATISSFNETEKFIFQNFIRYVQKISN